MPDDPVKVRSMKNTRSSGWRCGRGANKSQYRLGALQSHKLANSILSITIHLRNEKGLTHGLREAASQNSGGCTVAIFNRKGAKKKLHSSCSQCMKVGNLLGDQDALFEKQQCIGNEKSLVRRSKGRSGVAVSTATSLTL